jgi:hypothetical protein
VLGFKVCSGDFERCVIREFVSTDDLPVMEFGAIHEPFREYQPIGPYNFDGRRAAL